MIKLNAVSKSFRFGNGRTFSAIRHIDLSLEKGGIAVLRGPSGSGKTTLLSLVGCMARPTSGRIRVMNREITSLPERFLTEIRRKTFGFVFQQFNLIKGITALENAMLPAYPLGEQYASTRKRGLHLFSLFDISPKAHAKAEWLSGGEAQRVAIVRALMNNPSVIIADEPTAHLDTKLSLEFMDILGRLKEDGRTLILASHDPLVSESRVVDRVVNLRDGRIDGGSP